jgi:hypothetical protein
MQHPHGVRSWPTSPPYAAAAAAAAGADTPLYSPFGPGIGGSMSLPPPPGFRGDSYSRAPPTSAYAVGAPFRPGGEGDARTAPADAASRPQQQRRMRPEAPAFYPGFGRSKPQPR